MTTPAPTSRSDWAEYNAAQAGRGRIRPLTARAVDALAADADLGARHAVELGCGAGVEVEGLVRGLEVVELTERSERGPAFSGPKHWHVFTVIARARRRPSDRSPV